MELFPNNILFSLQVDRGQYNLGITMAQNKKTYETKLILLLNEMKIVNEDLDKKKLELEKIKESKKELKELYLMQYEEKIQKITEKRLLHLLKNSQIDLNINEEEQIKKELINEQQNIVIKMKNLMHITNLLALER